MKKTAKLLAMLCTVAMMVSLFAACGSQGGGDSTTAGTTAASGTTAAPETTAAPKKTQLVFGTSADYAPFEFHVLDGGEDKIVGFDVSLAQKIAEDMGVELLIKDINFDTLMGELDAGTVDMVLACIAPNEERLKVSDFSDSYYEDKAPVMLVRKADYEKFNTAEALNGKTIAAQIGTTKETIVAEQFPDSDPLLLTAVPDMVNNLLFNKCDAVCLDGAVADGYVAANPDLMIADGIVLGEGDVLGVAVKKGDPQGLLESINKTIAACLADGSLDKWMTEAEEQSANALN